MFTTWSAPCAFTTASFASLRPVAMTFAPTSFASCTAASPVAPDAPCTSTVSPAFSRPRVTRQWYAVS